MFSTILITRWSLEDQKFIQISVQFWSMLLSVYTEYSTGIRRESKWGVIQLEFKPLQFLVHSLFSHSRGWCCVPLGKSLNFSFTDGFYTSTNGNLPRDDCAVRVSIEILIGKSGDITRNYQLRKMGIVNEFLFSSFCILLDSHGQFRSKLSVHIRVDRDGTFRPPDYRTLLMLYY